MSWMSASLFDEDAEFLNVTAVVARPRVGTKRARKPLERIFNNVTPSDRRDECHR